MSALLLATRNPHKRLEISPIFERLLGQRLTLTDLSAWSGPPLPEVVEDQDTFEGNAIKKALETSLHAGMSALAEDSGLEVDALQGRPGVLSARFAGPGATTPMNNRLLVEQLRATPEGPARRARFVAVACLALAPDQAGELILAQLGTAHNACVGRAPTRPGQLGLSQGRALIWVRGHLEGQIIDEPRGAMGFGYDPHFLLPDLGLTLAQLSADQKNAISHRALALGALSRLLQGCAGAP